MNDKKSYAKYFASLLMFGMNGIVASHIALGSREIVLFRTLIGSLFLVALLLITRRRAHLPASRKHVLLLTCSGIALGASWMFLYEAYRQVGVGIASLLYYCGPVIVMVLAPILFREKLTFAKAAGFCTVLLGMCLVNTQSFGGGKATWGLVCGLMSALLYAVMMIFNKKAKGIAGLENSTLQLVAAFLTVAVFTGFKQGFALRVEAGSWIPILILGVFNTGIGCYFYFSSIGHLPVMTVAVCGYLEPLAAVVFSMLFLGERMTGVQMLGAVLIVGGAAFGELFRPLKKANAAYAGMPKPHPLSRERIL